MVLCFASHTAQNTLWSNMWCVVWSQAVYTPELLSSLLNCRCQLARMPRYTRRGRGRPPATTARAVRSSPRVSSRASRVAGQQSPPVATTQTVQPDNQCAKYNKSLITNMERKKKGVGGGGGGWGGGGGGGGGDGVDLKRGMKWEMSPKRKHGSNACYASTDALHSNNIK